MTRRALVTGASRGIGAAIARRLAADGHAVIVNFRSDADAAGTVVAAIEQAGGEAVASRFDVADRAATGAALARLLEDPRPIGILVNNAGIARDAAFPGMKHLQANFTMKDEIYQIKDFSRENVRVLLRLEPLVHVRLRVDAGDEESCDGRHDEAQHRHDRQHFDERLALLVGEPCADAHTHLPATSSARAEVAGSGSLRRASGPAAGRAARRSRARARA